MLKLNALETQKWWEWRKVEEIDQFVEKPAVALSLSLTLEYVCIHYAFSRCIRRDNDVVP